VRLHDQRTIERRVGVTIEPWLSPDGVAGVRLARRF
jgi:hypothetical protein